jgi:hypothetical protein
VIWRAIRWLVLVGVAWAIVQTLPSLARYLKIREM